MAIRRSIHSERSETVRRTNNKYIIMKGLNVLTIGLCLIAGFSSCKQQAQQARQASGTYKVLELVPVDRTLTTSYSAVIEGRQFVEIRPQVSGIITDVLVQEGANVKKGQTLFVIDTIPYAAAYYQAKAAVVSAEAQKATAELSLKGKQELYREKVISDFELQTAQNAYNTAVAALEQAKASQTNAENNLSFTKVKSPVNGSAGMTSIRVGTLVSSATSLIEVSDNSQMYVYFSLPEKEVLNLTSEYGSIEKTVSAYQDVTLTTSNGREYGHKGRIDVISGIVDKGTVSLRAVFNNPEGLLMSGGSGKITIPYTKTGCIVIPQEATYEIQDKVYTYKVIDGKAVSTRIKVFRINNGREYIVEEGLSAGDIIVAEGAALIKEGTTIIASEE